MRRIPSVLIEEFKDHLPEHFNPSFVGRARQISMSVFSRLRNPDTGELSKCRSLRAEWRNGSFVLFEYVNWDEFEADPDRLWSRICAGAKKFFSSIDSGDFKLEAQHVDEEKLENPFVVYRGGGYSGCFWQWDVWFPAEQKSLYGAGYNSKAFAELAMSDLSKAKERAEQDRGFVVEYPSDYLEFQKEFGVDLVVDTAKHLGWDLLCPECKMTSPSEDCMRYGLRSAGGITFEHTGFCCDDCMAAIEEENMQAYWLSCSSEERLDLIKHHNEQVLSYSCERDQLPDDAADDELCPVWPDTVGMRMDFV